MSDSGNAPSWLFSFVDLAFLLLIAMTQILHERGLLPFELLQQRTAKIKNDETAD